MVDLFLGGVLFLEVILILENRMAYVKFISDDQFKSIVLDILNKGFEAKRKKDKGFNRNVIDPFAIIFEMASFGLNEADWVLSEKKRQAQKSLSNHIGMVHQNILGAVKGWENLKVGKIIDIVNPSKKIIAEIKNKHNTIKGSNKSDLYYDLEKLVMPKSSEYKDYMAYYVEIIPKKADPLDVPFTPSNKNTGTQCAPNQKIRQIDGASFYKMVTGEDDALEQVFLALPQVISDCLESQTLIKSDVAKHFFKSAFIPKPAKAPKPPRTSRRKTPIASQ